MAFEGVPTGIVVGAAAVFGAVFGSFLNVCILRWGAEHRRGPDHDARRHTLKHHA